MKPKIPQQIFKNESVATPQHDEMLLLCKEGSKLLSFLINKFSPLPKTVPKRHIHKEDNQKKNDIQICYGGCYYNNNKKIYDDSVRIMNSITTNLSWQPEKAIVHGENKYYIGSVDLFVSFTNIITLKHHFILGSKHLFLESTTEKEVSMILEFKPKIISFSETIRQIKVYKTYLNQPNLKLIVITYSDISKFKEIFTSQGIEIIQLQKDGTNDSQTNLG